MFNKIKETAKALKFLRKKQKRCPVHIEGMCGGKVLNFWDSDACRHTIMVVCLTDKYQVRFVEQINDQIMFKIEKPS